MFRLIIPVLFIFSAIGIYFLSIQPGFAKVSSLQAQQRELEEATVIAGDITSILSDLSVAVDAISEDDREKLDRLLPTDGEFDAARFINDMNAMTLRRGIVLPSVQFSTDESGLAVDIHSEYVTEIGMFTVTYGVYTTYDILIEYLRDLELAEHLIDVYVTGFGAPDEDGGIEVSLDIRTYWLMDKTSSN